jgi:hypothetical protein
LRSARGAAIARRAGGDARAIARASPPAKIGNTGAQARRALARGACAPVEQRRNP